MSNIFICYSHKDNKFIKKLCLALTRARLSIWVVWENVTSEFTWYESVQQGIRSSDACLIVISLEFINSPSCALEIAEIIALEKPTILIVRHPDISIPEYLSRFNCIYFFNKDDFKIFCDLLLLTITNLITTLALTSGRH